MQVKEYFVAMEAIRDLMSKIHSIAADRWRFDYRWRH
jgi:hypothetical protein